MNEELINNVRQWFHDKGIIQKSNPLKQLGKTQEELNETRDAIVKLEYATALYNNHGMYFTEDQINDLMHELKDGIGDTVVTLIGVCEMTGYDFMGIAEDPLRQSYRELMARLNTIKVLDEIQAKLLRVLLEDSFLYELIISMLAGLQELASRYNFSLEECLQQAYDVISKRTGEVVDGVFIKDKEVKNEQENQ